MGVGPIINHICEVRWDALEMLLWEMGQKLPQFFPGLGSVSLWPWGGVPGPSAVCLGWVVLLGPLPPGLADFCSLSSDFYHSKRRLISSKRKP